MGGKQGTTTGDATTGEAQEAGQGAGKPQTGASVQTGNVTGQGPNVGGDEAKPGEAAAKEQRVAQAEPAAAQAGGGGAAAAPAGDPEAGKKVFNKCKACHAADKNKVGPHLGGVVGRPVASVADYTYSNAMKDHGGEWTPDRLDAYLADPRGVVKGTKMVFAGLKKEEDRANVIAYLTTLKAE
ncbi:MAG: cytochrome c family protein [Geminicoccaceae bacterium]|nr:cytochrome c family protein [Geminicoccaceae bacterium]